MSTPHVEGLVQLLGLARRHYIEFPGTPEQRAARNAAVADEAAQIIARMRAAPGNASSNSRYLNEQRLRGTRQDVSPEGRS